LLLITVLHLDLFIWSTKFRIILCKLCKRILLSSCNLFNYSSRFAMHNPLGIQLNPAIMASINPSSIPISFIPFRVSSSVTSTYDIFLPTSLERISAARLYDNGSWPVIPYVSFSCRHKIFCYESKSHWLETLCDDVKASSPLLWVEQSWSLFRYRLHQKLHSKALSSFCNVTSINKSSITPRLVFVWHQ
jgi:hypothetical protein